MTSRRIVFELAAVCLSSLLVTAVQAKSMPYGGKPVAIPGIIQAENFDLGGDNVGYHTKDNINHFAQYRPDEGVSLEKSTDTGGGYNIGWARAGDWLNYTIKVDKAGTYTIYTRVACVGKGGTFHYKLDFADATAAQAIPDTGGWQNWVTLSTTIQLPAGRHVLQLHEDTPGADSNGDVGNFNWIKIKKGGSGGGDGREKLLSFLKNTSGVATVVGMHNKYSSTPHSYTDENDAIAGRPSALWGGDFLFGDQVQYRSRMINEAKAQYAKGALVALTYHACSPKRDEYCSWDDIGGSNHAQLSDEEFRQLTTPGTTLYNNWIGRLNTLAGFFQELKDAGVAVVFRPLHEMNQCVFWWACHTGANGSAQLYRITHDYLTNTKGLTNIVWAWNIQDFSSMPNDLSRYDPGSAYYDVLTLDIYESGFRQDYYDTMVNYAKGKPIAVGEVQYMPSADKLRQQPKWTWVMQWSDFIYDNDHMIADLYAAPNVTTLDEMPGW